jgi:hypothetical protein
MVDFIDTPSGRETLQSNGMTRKELVITLVIRRRADLAETQEAAPLVTRFDEWGFTGRKAS